jgi:hypothetical protein
MVTYKDLDSPLMTTINPLSLESSYVEEKFPISCIKVIRKRKKTFFSNQILQ